MFKKNTNEYPRSELKRGIEKFNVLILLGKDACNGTINPQTIEIFVNKTKQHFENVASNTDSIFLGAACKDTIKCINTYWEIISHNNVKALKRQARVFAAIIIDIYNDAYLDME
jgi:hypothetical protein